MDRRKKWISRVITVFFFGLLIAVACHIYLQDVQRAEATVKGLDKSPIEVDRNRDYGEPGFRKVAENDNLILSADFTTGEISVKEKNTGKIWYSNPIDRDQDKVIVMKPQLASQINLTYFDLNTEKENTVNNVTGSINKKGMEYELIDGGVAFRFAFPAYGIIVPVHYTLHEDGLEAKIPIDELQELWSEKYIALSIELLPFFGAAGTQEEGYLLLPDGSGSLITFNNGKKKAGQFLDKVYGKDWAIESGRGSNKESIELPVFGLKNGDSAFLAVITSGDASSKISGTTSGKISSYNQVSSRAILREYSLGDLGGAQDLFDQSMQQVEDYSEILLQDCDYSVKYMFLDEENADYSGMALAYREYLTEQDSLKASVLAEQDYLILDLYGAVSVEKYQMGVKRKVVTPLTTYKDVCDIVRKLKDKGVKNLIVNYVGALKGGMERKMIDEVKAESCLGSAKEFEEMISYLEEQEVILFLEVDPVNLYEDGNGYVANSDSVKSFFGSYAQGMEYKLNKRNATASKKWKFLHPELVLDVVTRIAESASEKDICNLSLANLGEFLYTDLSKDDRGITRTEGVTLWKEGMQEVLDNGGYLMLQGGNAYCLSHADVITDVAVTGSRYDMEDYDVPFYQMVLGGNIVMGTKAINATADERYMFLKALETGCNLKYDLVSADVSMLVGTEYNDLVYCSDEYWLDAIAEAYLEYAEVSERLKGNRIVRHEYLNDKVTKTTYESGVDVIVNYQEEGYWYRGKRVEGRGYLLVEGGAR